MTTWIDFVGTIGDQSDFKTKLETVIHGYQA